MGMKIPINEPTTEASPKARVEHELEELAEKIGKISQYIYGDMNFANLSNSMQRLLWRQKKLMEEYASVLVLRLKIWDKTDVEVYKENIQIGVIVDNG